MKLGWYLVIGVGVVIALAVVAFLMLHNAHEAPAQLGSPSGFNGFVPSGQTVSYKGSQDPVGDLILNNGTTLPNVIWNGQYASTIIQIHNQIVQLNNQFVGQTDPVNNQPYVTLQDVYVIEGLLPIENATINGQVYYVIEANKINPANIAGFYTYQGWMNKFIAAINIPGTTAAGLPGNSPVYQWTNLIGTVVYQTGLYQPRARGFTGGYVLILPNGTIIPYGTIIPHSYFTVNQSLSIYLLPQQVYYIPPS